MILADCDIEFFRRIGDLDITPWRDEQLQPVSYDLTLAPEITFQAARWSNEDQKFQVDGFEWIKAKFWEHGPDGTPTHLLVPGEFALFSTVEKVRLGNDIVGHVEGKSTIARNGVIIHFAGLVDPGFNGQLTLEVKNLSTFPFLMTAGMSIAQIEFSLTRRSAARPYGSKGLGSHYQHQEGPTAPRT